MSSRNSDENIRSYDKKYFLEKEDGYSDFVKGKIADRFKRALDLVEIHSADKILDLGAGRGELGLILKDKVDELVLSDYSDDAIAIMKKYHEGEKNIKIEKINAKKILYPDDYFDKIFFLEVLEHLYYKESLLVLPEIKRVLKKGGELILSTAPNKYLSSPQYFIAEKFFKLELSGKKFHLNEFSYFSLKKIIKRFFKENKIYCYEEKLWFYQVISCLSLPGWFKAMVKAMNSAYDNKLLYYLRNKTFLRKFFAHLFLVVAKK